MINNRKKALIHVAKAKVGMTDPEYRDLLGRVGVKSSTELNDDTFTQVMDQFKRLGFKSNHKRSYKAGLKSKDRLISKIKALIIDLGLTNGYVDAIARNMFKVDVYKWCNANQLYKIVAALSYDQKRKKGHIVK